jgi:DNA-binding transcriptional ArsR family regulator
MRDLLSKKAAEVSRVLKQLAHPDRLKVLCCMLDGEKTAGELVEYVDASQSWVSQFLSKMKLSGLIDSRKEGVFVYYRIVDPRLKVVMQVLYESYCEPKKSKER